MGSTALEPWLAAVSAWCGEGRVMLPHQENGGGGAESKGGNVLHSFERSLIRKERKERGGFYRETH